MTSPKRIWKRKTVRRPLGPRGPSRNRRHGAAGCRPAGAGSAQGASGAAVGPRRVAEEQEARSRSRRSRSPPPRVHHEHRAVWRSSTRYSDEPGECRRALRGAPARRPRARARRWSWTQPGPPAQRERDGSRAQGSARLPAQAIQDEGGWPETQGPRDQEADGGHLHRPGQPGQNEDSEHRRDGTGERERVRSRDRRCQGCEPSVVRPALSALSGRLARRSRGARRGAALRRRTGSPPP